MASRDQSFYGLCIEFGDLTVVVGALFEGLNELDGQSGAFRSVFLVFESFGENIAHIFNLRSVSTLVIECNVVFFAFCRIKGKSVVPMR